MNVSWDDIMLNVRLADLLDILVASVVIYFVLQWLRQRAAHALAFGAITVAVLWFVAQLLGMYLTLAVFRVGLTIVIVAFLIVFQQDLRQGFERLSTWRPWTSRAGAESAGSQLTETLVEAVSLLAREKIGALLVLKGQQPLDRHLRGGIAAEAMVSIPLLHGIFNPKSQGHDGAVVISGDRVQLFAVHLPLSENLELVGRRGTRHTAALGLAERSDSMVVVVSEETGRISVAEEDSLVTVESPPELRQRLEAFSRNQSSADRKEARPSSHVRNLAAKVISVVVACALWLTFAFEIETIQKTFPAVPVEFRKLPNGLQVDQVRPARIEVTVLGPKRAFDNFSREGLTASIRLENASVGWSELEITESHFSLPEGIHLRFVDPPDIALLIETATSPANRKPETKPKPAAP